MGPMRRGHPAPPTPRPRRAMAARAASSLIANGLFTVQPYDNSAFALSDTRAGGGDGIKLPRGLDMPLSCCPFGQRHPGYLVSCLISSQGSASCTWTTSKISPPAYTPTALEMVGTEQDSCQLNSSRRILAEVQLRINGFNTYG